MAGEIRVGPAGWSYKDWNGVVYPPGRGVDQLTYISRYFDTIEINSSFYRPPSASVARSWLARTSHNRRFKFTAKLHRHFTHERKDPPAQEDESAFRAGIDPLMEGGALGALLIQFPWSYKRSGENRAYLARLITRFRLYPLVVELRHASWDEPGFYQSLEDEGIGFCNIDQPLYARSIKPSTHATSRVGYVRLHGRNYQNWFKGDVGAAERYDYLYTKDELSPWADNVMAVAARAAETYVIANNHFRGQAVVNALELKSMVSGGRVDAPPALLSEYPRLRESVTLEGGGHAS